MQGVAVKVARYFKSRAGNATPPPVPYPPGRSGVVNATDDDFPDGPSIAEGLGRSLFISYRDAKGNVSERRISVIGLRESAKGERLVRAFCHERQSRRDFRLDRIHELTDLSTGEVLEGKEIAAAIISYFVRSDAQRDTELYRCRYALKILAFLSLCDGHRHRAEEDVMLNYITAACDFSSEGNSILTRIRGLQPDSEQYLEAVEAFCEDASEAELRTLLRHARQLIDADGRVTYDEHFFAEVLQQEAGI